jgi:hypothetical protein
MTYHLSTQSLGRAAATRLVLPHPALASVNTSRQAPQRQIGTNTRKPAASSPKYRAYCCHRSRCLVDATLPGPSRMPRQPMAPCRVVAGHNERRHIVQAWPGLPILCLSHIASFCSGQPKIALGGLAHGVAHSPPHLLERNGHTRSPYPTYIRRPLPAPCLRPSISLPTYIPIPELSLFAACSVRRMSGGCHRHVVVQW